MTAALTGFAYGEHLDGPQRRSLGYRLLAPQPPADWCGEVEALARRLQGAPYPDHWPPADLFCSVLLDGGQRLIAVARYGLADHTPSRRRSGLELVGVLAPADLGVRAALAVYQWLRQRRDAADSPAQLAGTHDLAAVLAEAPPPPTPGDAVPVLPIRLWQEGALLFAATTPADPDLRLGLLEQNAGANWQWLPLVGGDFPLANYARRGPLVAWTPHLAGVALKLDQPPPMAARAAPSAPPRRWPVVAVGLAVALLLAANLALTADLHRRLPTDRPTLPVASAPDQQPPTPTRQPVEPAADEPAERLAQALHQYLSEQGVLADLPAGLLLHEYDRLASRDEGLRVRGEKGQQALGALAVLARRSPAQVEATVREALANKGYDPALVNLIAQRVHQRLADGRGP